MFLPLELDLAEALERIEAMLNERPEAFVNEDETTQKMRGIINDALKKATVTADHRHGLQPKVKH